MFKNIMNMAEFFTRSPINEIFFIYNNKLSSIYSFSIHDNIIIENNRRFRENLGEALGIRILKKKKKRRKLLK